MVIHLEPRDRTRAGARPWTWPPRNAQLSLLQGQGGSHAAVEKVLSPSARDYRRSHTIDLAGRVVGNPVWAASYHVNNVAHGTAAVDSGGPLAAAVPDGVRQSHHTPFTREEIDALDTRSAWLRVLNDVTKIGTFVWAWYKLRTCERNAKSEQSDPRHRALSLIKARGDKVRMAAFVGEKALSLTAFLCITTGVVTGGWGYAAAAAVLAFSHGANLLGFFGTIRSSIATLRDEYHLSSRWKCVAQHTIPQAHVRNTAEKLLAALHAESAAVHANLPHLRNGRRKLALQHVKALAKKTDEVRGILHANEEEAIAPLEKLAIDYHTVAAGVDAPTSWWRSTRVAAGEIWQVMRRRIRPKLRCAHTAEARRAMHELSEQREALLPETAERWRQLKAIEVEVFGQALVELGNVRRVADVASLPSAEECTSDLRRTHWGKVQPDRLGPEHQNALMRIADAPAKVGLSLAALYYMGATAVRGGDSVDQYHVVNGAHPISDFSAYTLMGLTVGISIFPLWMDLRSMRAALLAKDADSVFFYGAGVVSNILMSAGMAMAVSPLYRPMGILVQTLGAVVLLFGKYAFTQYWKISPDAGWVRRAAHRTYKVVRDVFVMPLWSNPLTRAVLRAPAPTPAMLAARQTR